ncbi:MAG: VTT domain-containing protein [Terriglobales bacterium]
MNAILQFVLGHGYAILFAILFAHQIGFPIPGPLFLLAAGALAAAGKLEFLAVVGLTIAACVLADWVWYEAGRRRGERVLHFIHGFTRDPDFHDRRAKRIFARYGLRILLIAKFVPGLDAVAPPLAAISGTGPLRFLAFDAAGAALYGLAYGGLGYVFSHDLDHAANYVSRAGTLVGGLILAGIFVYSACMLLQRLRGARKPCVVRIAPADPIGYGDSLDTTCGALRGGQRED